MFLEPMMGRGQHQMTGIEYLDGLYKPCDGPDPQPRRSGRSGTGNLHSRHAGRAEAARRQQHQRVALHHPEKYLVQPPKETPQRSSDGRHRFMPTTAPTTSVDLSRNSHDLYVSKLEAEQVRAAIHASPSRVSRNLLMREYEDLSYQEIARRSSVRPEP